VITVSAPNEPVVIQGTDFVACDATVTGTRRDWHIRNVTGSNSTLPEAASGALRSNPTYSSVDHPRALKIRRASAFGGSTPPPGTPASIFGIAKSCKDKAAQPLWVCLYASWAARSDAMSSRSQEIANRYRCVTSDDALEAVTPPGSTS
jgi:hypothetical protein